MARKNTADRLFDAAKTMGVDGMHLRFSGPVVDEELTFTDLVEAAVQAGVQVSMSIERKQGQAQGGCR